MKKSEKKSGVIVCVYRTGFKTISDEWGVPEGLDYVIRKDKENGVEVRCSRKDVKFLLDMFICQAVNDRVEEVKKNGIEQ